MLYGEQSIKVATSVACAGPVDSKYCMGAIIVRNENSIGNLTSIKRESQGVGSGATAIAFF
jgi:hypothetical protein